MFLNTLVAMVNSVAIIRLFRERKVIFKIFNDNQVFIKKGEHDFSAWILLVKVVVTLP